jgi:hypothetical protein
MAAETPPNHTQADLGVLAIELHALRDLLVTLSLQLTDMQFELDLERKAQALSITDQLLKNCRSHAA